MWIKFAVIGFLLVALVLGIRNEVRKSNDLDTIYPFVVALRTDYPNDYACGGVIISHDFILTLADCVPSELFNIFNTSKLHVIAGSVDLNSGGSLHIGIKRFIHEGYKPGKNDNNIAIVKVTPRFHVHVGEHLSAVHLELDQPHIGGKVFLPGWGSIQSNDYTYTNVLQHVELKTISNQVCREYNIDVNNNHLCTLTHIGQGACKGDQGSPLVVMGKVKKVIAIVTGDYSCGSGYPDVYIKVAPFIEWINATCNCIFKPKF